MSESGILREQLDYYAALAQEYDESIHRQLHFFNVAPPEDAEPIDFSKAIAAIHQLGSVNHALELACGAGLWTEHLVKVARRITALDGAQEMIDVNRTTVNDARVKYEQIDLFTWEPTQTYDLVFFGFWLSHIPPDALPAFLDKVQRAVKPGGHIFIVDEPAAGAHTSGPIEDGIYQTRTLQDGRTFRIVKVYYDPTVIAKALTQRGFDPITFEEGQMIFHLVGTRQS